MPALSKRRKLRYQPYKVDVKEETQSDEIKVEMQDEITRFRYVNKKIDEIFIDKCLGWINEAPKIDRSEAKLYMIHAFGYDEDFLKDSEIEEFMRKVNKGDSNAIYERK